MRLGAVFPQVEIEPDPGAIRRYAQGLEDLGFDHVLIYDHVTGVDPDVHADFAGVARAGGATSAKPYDVHDTFHEVMVLLGFLAAATSRLGLATGVLVLPQRQTALVAKQAAEVDLLSGGRLRLGVGIGWNRIEFRSLGHDFRRRGRRIDHQIDLLRRYWTETTVRYDGEEDWADGVGIAPAPVQRPIPVWIAAGAADKALARAGRLGDGWMPVAVDPVLVAEQFEVIRAHAASAGRDPSALGVQARLETAASRPPGEAAREAQAWAQAGATHLAVNTMRCGLRGADAHLEALAALRDELGDQAAAGAPTPRIIRSQIA